MQLEHDAFQALTPEEQQAVLEIEQAANHAEQSFHSFFTLEKVLV